MHKIGEDITNMGGGMNFINCECISIIGKVNLFDKDNANILNTALDSNGLGSDTQNTYLSIYIPCKPNTTYTIKKLLDTTKNRFSIGCSENIPTYNMSSTEAILLINNNSTDTINATTNSTANYLIAYIWITGGTNTKQDELNNLMIFAN